MLKYSVLQDCMSNAPAKASLTELAGRPDDAEHPEPGYDAWKAKQVATAVAGANRDPETAFTHDQVFGALKAKFRP